VDRDQARAAELFKKGCDGGEAKSCVNLGVMRADGLGVGKDPAAAAKLFEKGCNDGEAAGCGLLGKAYLAGAGVSSDPARAASLLEQACDGADARSCGAAGVLYAEGNGVQRDVARAAKLYQRACNGGDAASCGAVGLLYETGNGVGKNPMIAAMMYQRGCMRGNADACADEGRMELAKPAGANLDQAKRKFEWACNFRSTIGCAVLKAVYGQNRPVIPDPQRVQALRKSCTSGNARDCATVGVLTIAQGNKPGGLIDLQNACTRGDAFACTVAKQVK
jgi:TPR repeat protein